MSLKVENQKIANKIKLLAQVKPRKEWKDSFRDILMSETKQAQHVFASKATFFGYFSAVTQSAKFHVFQPAVAILLVIGVFVGSSLVVNAAFYSLPGDKLYDLKIAMEKTQVSIIIDNEKKAELRIEFVKNRVEEFEKMAVLRPEDLQKDTIAQITQRFKSDVEFLNAHMNELDQQQKSVFTLAKAIDLQTTELAKALSKSIDKLPDDVKREVEQSANDAVDTAENTSQSAFRIALNSYYKEGELVEVEEEVIDLIQTKIDALEQKINSLEDGETLEQAQSSLNEAKNSLENGDFDQTVEQIARGQELIALLEEEQKELEGVTDEENELNLEENDEDVPAEAQDSQNLELDDQIGQMIIQSTTTDGSVEDTILETTSETID